MGKKLELDDMQGLILHGYARRKHSVYALLHVGANQKVSAASWLRNQIARVGRADAASRIKARDGQTADPILAIAFTHAGLATLGLDRAALETFVPEFRQGMTSPHRQRVLGDVDGNDHRHWRWGGTNGEPVHVLYAAYADSAPALNWGQERAAIEAAGLSVVSHVFAVLTEHEPFGFRDGMSQPILLDSGTRLTDIPEHDRIRPGEFVLGYRNEFEQLPSSPYVRAALDLGDRLQRLDAKHRDLGLNGSYLVARELEQDVAAFKSKFPNPDDAAALVGRWSDGTPLVREPRRPVPKSPAHGERAPHALDAPPGAAGRSNDFSYYALDRDGLRCPLGAHVRRANPRDARANEAVGIGPVEAYKLANQHRLLRRSRVYERPDVASTGLFFLCLNANIDRQFEFVQQTWLNNVKFTGVNDERDALLVGGDFTTHVGLRRERMTGLAAYVRVRGGGYFFLPGLRALEYIANL